MVDSRGSRILADLDTAFRLDPDVDEYDYIPVLEPVQNCSPLIKEERKIGLEMWCVKILYSYAYEKLMSWRRKDPQSRDIEPDAINSFSRAVLMINPDVKTIWNVRKEQIDRECLSVEDDLKLGALILGKHPKSSEAFSHRKWLLERWMTTDRTAKDYISLMDEVSPVNLDSIEIDDNDLNSIRNRSMRQYVPMPNAVKSLVFNEIEICATAADKYASNYNAWSHRIWTIQHLTRNDHNILLSELNMTKDWVHLHISDHSGFHYRQFLINLLCNHRQLREDDLKDILVEELVLSSELVQRYPDHEAIWCHRRFIVIYLQNHPDVVVVSNVDFGCENKAFVDTEAISSSRTSSSSSKKSKLERPSLDLLHEELEFCKQFEKSKHSSVKRLQKKYKEWLQRTINNQ